jgi:hypothetical protein
VSLHPRDLTYGMTTASDDEAQRALDEPLDEVEQEGRQIRARQTAARDAVDLDALAHWSRMRWRWLVGTGRARVRL